MRQNIKIGAVAVAALSMAGLSMAATYTWTGTNNDWTDAGNWDANGVPATTSASNYVGGANNNIVINGGGVQPSVNIPDMVHGGLGESPKVTLGANATLTMKPGASGTWTGMKGVGTMATVGTGATLTYDLNNHVGYFGLARDPVAVPLQTFDVNGGQLVFNNGGRLDLGFNVTRTSAFNLDNGDVVFNHKYGNTTTAPYMQVWGAGSLGGTSTGASLITLDNGSNFGTARLGRTKWDDGNAAMIFDILDTGSTVSIAQDAVDGYASLAAVQADLGTVFTSSTLGVGNLLAEENTPGIYTVTVIPEPATLGLVAAFGGGILFIRRRFMI
ncbi:PEP-CTERM sorting domain-containing protein [Pontiellaceae bacterium B12227]|nr:PEP-CTERM sorting domain-containing protein [Pontiellaceae bacterium B12227]